MGYRLINWYEFWSADWVQAWGSFAGAALGAGLAFGLAVWFQGRSERRRAATYSAALIILVRRNYWMAKAIISGLKPFTVLPGNIAEEADEMRRDAAVLARMSPFSEIGSAKVAMEMMDLTALNELFVAAHAEAAKTLIPISGSTRINLNNSLVRITDACEEALQSLGFRPSTE